MNTTSKQRLLWIVGITLAGLYYCGPSIINSSRRASQVRPGANAGKAASPLPVPASSADSSGVAGASPELDKLFGIWQGAAPLPVGMCNLKIELRRKEGDPSHFAGFPVLACIPVMPNLSPEAGVTQQALLASLTPVSAVLTGTAANGSIQFAVDKVIGKTLAGCALTSVSVTPFGADQISAEWQEGTCPGGQLLLKRIGK
jgi:hypothetical protein